MDDRPEIADKQSKSTAGGRRPGAGRPAGRKNNRTLWLEDAAQKYGKDALKVLHHVAMNAESESAQVSAAVALLDRGWGKPRQALEHSGKEGGPLEVSVTHRVIRGNST